MDYVFTVTEYDADNVDSSFSVNHGRTEHTFDLTQQTYNVTRVADGISPQVTPMVWEQSIAKIQYYLNIEIRRVATQLQLEKTRLYEINYFKAYMRISPDETNESTEANIKQYQDTLTFLKNYIP